MLVICSCERIAFCGTLEVPLLNALDCWMSYCIMILVAASALYLEPINKEGRCDMCHAAEKISCRDTFFRGITGWIGVAQGVENNFTCPSLLKHNQ